MLPLPKSPDDDPAAWRCDVGVVFALGAEQGGLEDLLTDVTTIEAHGHRLRHGLCGGRRVTTIVAGPGAERAAQACEVLFQGHRPRWVISAGFCGALDPKLRVETVLLADALYGDDGASDHLSRSLLKIPVGAIPPPAATGRFAQVDRIVCRATDKKSLAAETHSIACDMESLAVAQACLNRDVPFSAVRAVSDTAEEDLPSDLDQLMQARSVAGTLGAVVGAIWRRPSSVKDMLRLKERALMASVALGKYLVQFIGALPLEGDRLDPKSADDPRPHPGA